MIHKIKISIPKPCHENWFEMTPIEKGKFCSNCQKNVIDFTKVSDREIILEYNKNENLCGRFRASQLDRILILPKEKKSIWIIAAASIIGFLGLGNQTAKAQANAKTEQTDNKQLKDNIKEHQKKGLITYKGTLYNSENYPVEDVNVKVKRTKIETKTNFDGEFTITAKKGAILIFQSSNIETFEFKLGNESKIKVKMKNHIFIGEVVKAKIDDD